MALTEQALSAALQTVLDPNTGKDFVSTKALKNLQIQGGDVSFDVVLGYPAKSQIPGLRKSLIAAAKTVAGVDNVSANVTVDIVAHAAQRAAEHISTCSAFIKGASSVAWACVGSTWRDGRPRTRRGEKQPKKTTGRVAQRSPSDR